jgi:HD superfamily phosphodiesterase
MKIKPVYQTIFQLAKPYLNTRHNEIHAERSMQYGYRLMETEGGNESVIIPAIILHDVGWKKVPEALQLKAFGPKASMPELIRVHEKEGVRIAGDILVKVNYDNEKTTRILEIIGGHDSRKESISLDDRIVKDADKLWRCSKEGFNIDNERFEQTYVEGLNRLRKYLSRWFFTDTANRLAREELQKREEEAKI